MRLPFLQLDSEVLDVTAPEVAIALDWTEEAAVVAVLRMVQYVLARCPDDAPPSAHAVIRGPNAARILARVAKWAGDPDAFVAAFCGASHPVLERLSDGIRLRGTKRYDEAWLGQKDRSAKAKAAADARWAQERAREEEERARAEAEHATSNARASAEHPPSTAPTVLGDAKTQIKTQTQIETQSQNQRPESEPERDEPPPQYAREGWQPPGKPEPPPDPFADGMSFFAQVQVERHEDGLPREKPPNHRKLSAWWSEVHHDLDGDVALLVPAYREFSKDPFWRSQKPPLPFPAFMSQWRKYVPPRPVQRRTA